MSDAHQKLPTEDQPLTEDERWMRAADWSDYRKAYGADPDPVKLKHDFELFCAGWDAGRRTVHADGSVSSEEWAAARGDGWTFFRRSDGRVVADGPEGRDGRDWPNLDAALVATRPVHADSSG